MRRGSRCRNIIVQKRRQGGIKKGVGDFFSTPFKCCTYDKLVLWSYCYSGQIGIKQKRCSTDCYTKYLNFISAATGSRLR